MKRKELIFLIPEIYLLCATIYYWILTANLLNPIAIGLLIILSFQIVTRKLILGLLIASIFVLLNLYLVLALISEMSEFTSYNNKNFIQLLVFGTLFLGFNLIAGIFMFRKYSKKLNG